MKSKYIIAPLVVLVITAIGVFFLGQQSVSDADIGQSDLTQESDVQANLDDKLEQLHAQLSKSEACEWGGTAKVIASPPDRWEVVSIKEGSPWAKLGFKESDEVTMLDGQPPSLDSLLAMLQTTCDQKHDFKILRDGQAMELQNE